MLRRPLILLATAAALALPASAHAGAFTWSAASNINPGFTLNAISCPAADLCVAVDGANPSNVLSSANPTGGPTAWTSDPVGVNGFSSMNAISCPSTTLCVATDSAGFVYWTTDPIVGPWLDSGANVNGGNTLRAISCPSTSLCVAAGLNGIVYSTNPTGGFATWTPVAADTGNLPVSISCPTVTLCVLGDDVGNVVTTTTPTGAAGGWTPAVVSADLIGAMSCASATLCVAGDDGGNSFTSTTPTVGTSWNSTNIAATDFVNDLSCAPGTSTCVAMATAAKAIETIDPNQGSAGWSTTLLASTMQGVSCPSELLCAAVGGGGNAFFASQGRLTVALGGSGAGSVSGPSFACPSSCSKLYPGGTAVTLTAAPAADSTFAGWSGDCTGTGQCSTTLSQSRSVVANFDPIPAASPAVADPTPTPSQNPPGLPPPVVAETANAIPVQPGVLVKLPGTTKFVPLQSPSQIQFGAVIDARKGRVRLVIANGKGGFDSADFYQGVFRITQLKAKVPIAELTLVGSSFKKCPRARTVRAAAVKKGKSIRHLWGDGSGAFRTKGRFASATIRGTRWLTDDRCNGTLVRVAAGAVTVRDLKKRKSLALKAPKSYFAAP
jgi:hypothetical protein